MPAKPGSLAALTAVSASALALGLSACGSGGSGDSGALGRSRAPTSATPDPADSSRSNGTATTGPRPPPHHAASPSPTQPPHVGLQPATRALQVLALQKRLTQLGFWLSAADGSYGDTTEQAVLAFQKAAGLERDGVAGPQTMKALQAGVTVAPRSTAGHVIEVDKTRQLVLIVDNGKIDDIFNTSTGSGQPYQYARPDQHRDDPVRAVHDLPAGRRRRPGPARRPLAAQVLQRRHRPPRRRVGARLPGQPRLRAPVRRRHRLDLEHQPGAHRHQRSGSTSRRVWLGG